MLARRFFGFGAGGSVSIPTGLTTVSESGSRLDVMTGTAYKSFPGMTLRGSRLHLVYRNGTAHNSAGSTIDYKYTDDLGATWSTPGTAVSIVTATGTDDVRDPCILATASGRLLVCYDMRSPYSSANITGRRIYSDDGGATWSSAYTIPSAFSGTENGVVTSQPIQLANGDILLPAYGDDGGNAYSIIYRSTDDGLTFAKLGDLAKSAARDYQEPQIRLLASGTIVALLRSESNHHTWRCTSTDSGATWSTPTDVLNFTGRPDFVEIGTGMLLLLGRYNTTADSPLYFTYSADEGVTWATQTEVDVAATALAMYSAPVVTSTNTATVVYSVENSSSDADLYLRTFVAS